MRGAFAKMDFCLHAWIFYINVNYLFLLAQIFKINIQNLQSKIHVSKTPYKFKTTWNTLLYYYFAFKKFPVMRSACVQRIAAAAGVEGMRAGDPPLCIPPPPHPTQTQKLSPRSNKICTVSTIRYKTGCLIRICVSDLLLASFGSYTDYTGSPASEGLMEIFNYV